MSPLRLVQFSDPHLFGTESGRLRGVDTYRSLIATLEQAKRDHWPADAVLVTGDLVQDDTSGYALFRRVFSALNLPVYCVPGNHDDASAMTRALAAPPFTVGGYVDQAYWRIVLLDSSLRGSARGRLSEANLGLLESALESAGDRHVLVCLHHHPVVMNSRWLDTVGLENASDFFRIIDRFDRARAVIWGHVHQSFEGLRGSVRLLGTPSTCSQFVPNASDFEIDILPPAFRTLSLAADGSIDTQVVWVDREETENAPRHRVSSAA